MKRTNLVVNVVIIGAIALEPLKVGRQGVSAVVVDGPEGGDRGQKCGLADGHVGQPFSDASTTQIQNEALDRMVLQCAKNTVIQLMVIVEFPEEELVHVHAAVQEVLTIVERRVA